MRCLATVVIKHYSASQMLVRSAVALLLLAACTKAAVAQTGKPFFDAHAHTTRYAGPDDAAVAISSLSEIRIGYFGPADPKNPRDGAAWHAACHAVKQANARGGFHGKPFRLVTAWSENPWGTGVKDLTRLVYQQHVWAIIGGMDGPTTHLAEQVVAKARLPLISPTSTDKSVNMANVPWMFSLTPDDGQIADILAPAIARRAGRRRLVLIGATDHDAHVAAVELRKVLTRLEVMLQLDLEFDPADADWHTLAAQCVRDQPAGVIVMASASASAQLVKALRRAGYAGPVFGGVEMGRRAFYQQAGKDANGVVFPWIIDWPRAIATKPHGTDVTHGKSKPSPSLDLEQSEFALDYSAVLTYDATRLVIQAIRRGGLGRAEIGRELRQIVPWRGQSGPIAWDGLGRNTRKPTLATWRDGRPQPR